MKKTLIAVLCMGLSSGVFAAPATLVQSVTYNGETVTMQLTQETLRGSEFELWSQNSSGGYDVITPVDERSYMGTVDGYPGAVSCGILQDDGQFRGAVYFDRGVTWFTLGTTVVETRALDYGTFSAFQYPSAPTVGAGQAGSTMYAYDLGVDADYDYFSNAGNNVAKAFEGIEYSVCLVRAIYMRDALLRPYLGRVIIRATLAQDPYTGLSQGDYLGALKTEWNTNHTDANRDLVSGASPTKIGGGLAWVGVVGSSSGYSVSQSNSSGNFDVVFRHEMGHNWGCGHFEGGLPEGKGIMGGNAPARFSGCELYIVLNHRTSRVAYLDGEGTYTAIELPPYASMDAGEFTQTLDSSITFNVLANDHDANGQTVSLYSYDGTSANGGSVTQQGQNLVYAPPGAFLGTDYFTYTITDTVGRTAKGVVVVDVQPNDSLRLYLPLDETSGTIADDQSAFEN
ncbi:MAG: cadherin-like domain-containing protein, partial [Verrucomicrobia bacterium]|nr:cadherin-like domain-containing protein [Verrucomicrobiota bacterium]